MHTFWKEIIQKISGKTFTMSLTVYLLNCTVTFDSDVEYLLFFALALCWLIKCILLLC